MGILTDDMKRLIDEQKLAFHATVCPDGSLTTGNASTEKTAAKRAKKR